MYNLADLAAIHDLEKVRMKPKVLLATTCRWFSTARLALAFSEFGSTVELVSPGNHPATKTTAISRRYGFRGLAPLASFQSAINAAKPDLIVSCDDLSTIHLQQLYGVLLQKGETNTRSVDVLRRSLGPASSFSILQSRTELMTLARSLGVRVPETSVVTRASLTAWLMKNGFPAVLKSDGSGGGKGVQIVHSMDAAEYAFAELSAPPLALRAVKRALFDRDRTLLRPCLQRSVPVVNAQVLVRGHDATVSVACWEGEVVASISAAVIQKQMQDGPSSVLRIVEHSEMSQAAEKIVRRLQLSGFFGFDFILTEQNDCATLIEMNARATQVCHLALGTRHNLAVALLSKAGGESIPETRPVSDLKCVALFPQEWHRDPASEHLSIAYHDVPWREPELMKASIDFYHRQRRWFASRRFVSLYRKFSASPPIHAPIKPVSRP